MIGGIKIDSDVECIAHSDGDVLLHALCDALLGAAALGDIGELFPDNNMKYKNMDSSFFIKEVVKLYQEKSLRIVNIDATIILEKPKLAIYKPLIRNNIAELLNIASDRVNIKAKTNEKMGFVGRKEGIVAYCICEVINK